MKRSLKLLVVLCFVSFGAFGLVTSAVANRNSGNGQKSSRAESTKDIYLQNCARCHGVDGHGQTEQGRKYNVPDLPKETKYASSGKITRIITNGRQDMPAFGKKLTKKQIAALGAYVKKL